MMTVNQSVAHPWQCDVLGHLTTRFYVAMFDDASYHFLYRVFGFDGNRDPEGRFGWVDVRHEIDYLAEVPAGTLLEIRAHLARIGGKSITACYEMRNAASGEPVARLQAVCALFDLGRRQAARIPDPLRERAAQHLRPPQGEP